MKLSPGEITKGVAVNGEEREVQDPSWLPPGGEVRDGEELAKKIVKEQPEKEDRRSQGREERGHVSWGTQKKG